jgi:peptide/nickel transport system substrate-binding protein
VRKLVQLVAASALSCALAALSACGGADDQEPRPAGRGGTLTMLSASDVDFLDPGRTIYVNGFMVASATQRPLYGFAPGDLSTPRPDMAAAPPEVSADGRTVTVALKRGVRFSPPVDREVTSRDIAYAFERLFSASVGGPYASYFRALVGVPATPAKAVRRLSGITTPDAHTIVFRLRPRSAPAFVGALVLAATAPVPEEYARPLDAKSPSTYNTHVVATGPYMVRNDRAGNAVGYQPGRLIELVRNPSWNRALDRRPAPLDAIRIRTNASDTTIAGRQVLAGSHLAMDATPPPTILKRVAGDGGATSARIPQGGYRFLPLNTTLKPFDRVDVRRAVLAGFDREAARRARGGAATGPLATHFLPPGIPGHEEAGGADGPGVDFLSPRSPGGDPELAAEYMRKAGFPSGRYTGDEQFLLVSANTDSDRGVAQVVQEQLGKLGFKTRLRYVPTDALFTDWCTVPAKKVLTCASSIAWLKDFPDPEPMLRPVFDGDAISKPTNNNNYSQLNDPLVDAAIEAAAATTGRARARAWGAVDRMILSRAAAIPLQWDSVTLIRSKDVKGVANRYFASWDLSYTSLR